MKVKTPKNSTTHYLKEKEEGRNPNVTWKILESNIAKPQPQINWAELALVLISPACRPAARLD